MTARPGVGRRRVLPRTRRLRRRSAGSRESTTAPGSGPTAATSTPADAESGPAAAESGPTGPEPSTTTWGSRALESTAEARGSPGAGPSSGAEPAGLGWPGLGCAGSESSGAGGDASGDGRVRGLGRRRKFARRVMVCRGATLRASENTSSKSIASPGRSRSPTRLSAQCRQLRRFGPHLLRMNARRIRRPSIEPVIVISPTAGHGSAGP